MKNLVYFTFLSVLLFSCRPTVDDKVEPIFNKKIESQYSLNDIENKNGTLVFKDESHLALILSSMDDKEISSSISKKVGFISLYKKRLEIPETMIEKIASSHDISGFENFYFIREIGKKEYRIEPTIADESLEKLLNINSSLVVGDKIYKYTRLKLYKSDLTNADLKDEVFNFEHLEKLSVNTEVSFSLVKFPDQKLKINGSVLEYEVQENGQTRKYRFCGNYFVNNLGVAARAGASVSHDKRMNGIFGTHWWSGHSTQKINFNATGTIEVRLPLGASYSSNFSIPANEYNVGSCSKTFDFWIGNQIGTISLKNCFATSNNTGVDGTSQSFNFYD